MHSEIPIGLSTSNSISPISSHDSADEHNSTLRLPAGHNTYRFAVRINMTKHAAA